MVKIRGSTKEKNLFPIAATAKRMVKCWLALTVIIAVAMVAASSAPARMSIGIQNDEGYKYDSAAELVRARMVGADTVRIMVPYNQWHDGEADVYVHTAAMLHDAGLHVMATLFSWNVYPTPAKWAAFAREAGSRLSPFVDFWGIMNEPNELNMAPHVGQSCVIGSYKHTKIVPRVRYKHLKRRKGHYKRIVRFRHARHGHWRKVVKHRHGHRIVRFRRVRHARHGHWKRKVHFRHLKHRRGHWRKVVKHVRVTSSGKQKLCSIEDAARVYRAVWDATAPVLRAADPSAELIVGDLCPCAINQQQFMDAFYAGGPPAVRPDVLGVHPYDSASPQTYAHDGSWRASDIEDAAAWARSHGMRLFVSEWALDPSMPAARWRQWLSRFQAAGVQLTVLYDVTTKPGWDTRLRRDALRAVASWNSL